MHTELLSYFATAPGAGGAVATAVAGDSLIVRNAQGAAPMIIAAWCWAQAAGYHQLSWPSGHDTTRGYRYNVTTAEIDQRLAAGLHMTVEPQEAISATISGSGTAGDVELGCLYVHYPSLPGVTQRALTWDQLLSRMQDLTTVSATLVGSAAGYTGAELLNAESDLLRANTDYAILGMTLSVDCAAVWISGPDTGFTKVAAPGDSSDNDAQASWFCRLSRAYALPLIPVINSGNKSSTQIGILQAENNVTTLVTLYLARLKRGS